jgi:hypothetical protein
VRVVLPPRGLNEVLVGGARTRPRSALGDVAARLTEPFDRARLREIQVKPVRRSESPQRGETPG